MIIQSPLALLYIPLRELYHCTVTASGEFGRLSLGTPNI